MAYRNKTYICFDGDEDIHFYRLMTAWHANDKFGFEFYDAHDLNKARDTSQEESIKRQLRDRLANSKIFVVLIGEKTRYLTKFVKWEMEAALQLDLPIVGVNLNGSRGQDERCPPTIREALAVYRKKMVERIAQSFADAAKEKIFSNKLVIVIRPQDAEDFGVNLFEVRDYLPRSLHV